MTFAHTKDVGTVPLYARSNKVWGREVKSDNVMFSHILSTGVANHRKCCERGGGTALAMSMKSASPKPSSAATAYSANPCPTKQMSAVRVLGYDITAIHKSRHLDFVI